MKKTTSNPYQFSLDSNIVYRSRVIFIVLILVVIGAIALSVSKVSFASVKNWADKIAKQLETMPSSTNSNFSYDSGYSATGSATINVQVNQTSPNGTSTTTKTYHYTTTNPTPYPTSNYSYDQALKDQAAWAAEADKENAAKSAQSQQDQEQFQKDSQAKMDQFKAQSDQGYQDFLNQNNH